MSGYIPSPADYAGFLMAARQQQLLLLQHLQRSPPATPARTSQSSGSMQAAPPDPKDLIPLQPLLPDWMANAFGIPLLNMPVGECRGMPRAPLPVPQPYAIPPGLWGTFRPRPLAPPQVTLGNAVQRPAQSLMEQQCLFPPAVTFPHPLNMNLINGARPGNPYPFPFPPVPDLSPTADQKDVNACAAASLRGLLIPPVPHVPPVGGNVVPSAASPPREQSPAKLKRPAEKPRENDMEEGNGEYPVKRTRLVWTPHLHRLFVDAVDKLGEDAVPKNIMQVMDVEGLTRSNVASHLQKYRLQLKKQPRSATRRAPMTDDVKARTKPKFSTRGANCDNGRSMNSFAPNLACTTERNCTSAEECRHDHTDQMLGIKGVNEVPPSTQPSDTVVCAGMEPAGGKSSSVGWYRDSKTDFQASAHQSETKKSSGSEKQSCIKLMGNGGPYRPNDVEIMTNGTDRSMHDFNPDLGPESVE
ncbi:hypothetical protein BSKO_08064 [Bryopsis sp. KO-2023]|nr:hypothetical protein BSKO_08064 [Bryopsis sp. KO-2023]